MVKSLLVVTPPPSAMVIATSPSVYSIKGVCKDVEATWVTDVIDVASVTTPASTFIVPSRIMAEPVAGLMFIAPIEVPIVTAASPGDMSSAFIDEADRPVSPEPSPVTAVAANVPSIVNIPLAKDIRFVSSS